MKYPPDFERSRGFGFVTYKDVKMMEKCLKQNPHFIDDFQVEARRAVARENVGHDYDPDWDDAGKHLVHKINLCELFLILRHFVQMNQCMKEKNLNLSAFELELSE